MRAIHLHVALGPDHQQTCAVQISRKVHQQVKRPSVRVVQIFEHHQERLRRGGTPQKVGGRLQQPPATTRPPIAC